MPSKFCLQCVVGGTNADSEAKRMANKVPNVLVATPGRLVDHLQNYGADKYMSNIDTFVLDEADRLLDMGFRYCMLTDATAWSAHTMQQIGSFALPGHVCRQSQSSHNAFQSFLLPQALKP